MKRFSNPLHRLFTALMAAMLLFMAAGCQPSVSSQPEAPSSVPSAADPSSQEQPSKIDTSETLAITCWANMVGNATGIIQSYDEVESLTKWAEMFNLDITWQHPPTGQGKEQLQLLFVGNNLPDIHFGRTDWMPESEDSYIDAGVLVNLADYEEYMPNYAALLNKEDFGLRNDITTPEGRIARMPNVYGYLLPGEGNPSQACNEGLQLRQDWLDKLNLQTPNTIEEFHDVLVAVRDRDPNGNGEKDEIPLVVRELAASWGGLTSLCTSFGVQWTWGFRAGEPGKVCYGPAQPEFKDFIAEMAKWYAEGLIDPDFMSTDDDSQRSKFLGDKAFATWSTATSAGIGEYNQSSENPDFNLVAVQAFKSDNGTRYYHKNSPATINTAGMYFSPKCPQLERVINAVDYGYSHEGSALLTLGIGIDTELYTYDASGAPIAATEEFQTKVDADGWGNSIVKYAVGALNSWFDVQYPVLTLDLVDKISGTSGYNPKEVWEKDVSWDLCMPSFAKNFMTAEETDRFNLIMNDVDTYCNEEILKFIIGKRSVEEWDDYMDAANNIGLPEATEIYQRAYDRYSSR